MSNAHNMTVEVNMLPNNLSSSSSFWKSDFLDTPISSWTGQLQHGMRAGKGYTKSKLASFSLISLHPIDITSTIGRRLFVDETNYLLTPWIKTKSEQIL